MGTTYVCNTVVSLTLYFVPQGWSPAVCFNFLDRFLEEVETVVGQNEDVVCVFKYDPRHQISEEVCLQVVQEEGSDKLLPDLL